MDFLSLLPLLSFVFISTLLSGRIIVLKRKGIRVSSKEGKKPKWMVFIYPVFGALFLVWVAELIILALPDAEDGLLPRWFTHKLFYLPAFQIAGIVVVVLSLVLLSITLLHFKRSLRFGLDENNQGELITSGIFSWTRNPFFVSINAYFAGLALLHPSLLFIAMAGLTVFSIHFFILKEEKFLRQHHGDDYHDYSKKVGRYL